MAYATIEDLEARWRQLADSEQARASILLEDAASRIDVAAPPAGPLTEPERRVRLIVSCDMVKRAMQAPDAAGVEQTTQTAGSFSTQMTFANPAGDLYLSRADLRLLGVLRQKAGNVSLRGRVP